MSIARWTAMVSVTLVLTACEDDTASPSARPDARIEVYDVQPSDPTPEGLAYLQSVAQVHARADEADPLERVRVLREGLAAPVPADLPEAEIARLDLGARLAETALEQPGGAVVARDVLEPMLDPGKTLPLDRATARALVALGDAAEKSGEDALAAGSYARAIRVMSLLREELEP